VARAEVSCTIQASVDAATAEMRAAVEAEKKVAMEAVKAEALASALAENSAAVEAAKAAASEAFALSAATELKAEAATAVEAVRLKAEEDARAASITAAEETRVAVEEARREERQLARAEKEAAIQSARVEERVAALEESLAAAREAETQMAVNFRDARAKANPQGHEQARREWTMDAQHGCDKRVPSVDSVMSLADDQLARRQSTLAIAVDAAQEAATLMAATVEAQAQLRQLSGSAAVSVPPWMALLPHDRQVSTGGVTTGDHAAKAAAEDEACIAGCHSSVLSMHNAAYSGTRSDSDSEEDADARGWRVLHALPRSDVDAAPAAGLTWDVQRRRTVTSLANQINSRRSSCFGTKSSALSRAFAHPMLQCKPQDGRTSESHSDLEQTCVGVDAHSSSSPITPSSLTDQINSRRSSWGETTSVLSHALARSKPTRDPFSSNLSGERIERDSRRRVRPSLWLT
jgi:hypothetical protein